jgi:hypothetical protein
MRSFLDRLGLFRPRPPEDWERMRAAGWGKRIWRDALLISAGFGLVTSLTHHTASSIPAFLRTRAFLRDFATATLIAFPFFSLLFLLEWRRYEKRRRKLHQRSSADKRTGPD